MRVGDSREQVLDDLVAVLLPSLLDLADLLVGFLVGFVLCRLVSLRVLQAVSTLQVSASSGGLTDLCLGSLVLGFLFCAVCLDLLLGLVSRLPHALGAVCLVSVVVCPSGC